MEGQFYDQAWTDLLKSERRIGVPSTRGEEVLWRNHWKQGHMKLPRSWVSFNREFEVQVKSNQIEEIMAGILQKCECLVTREASTGPRGEGGRPNTNT